MNIKQPYLKIPYPGVAIFFNFNIFDKITPVNNPIWNEILEELRTATASASHPFRFAALATIGLEQVPRQRTIVLREFIPETQRLTFFTDARSKKMLHIKENNKVSLLLYHPEKQLQVRLEGLAVKETDRPTLEAYWGSVKETSRKEYATAGAPGTELDAGQRIDYLKEDHHFTVVHVHPFRMEYLQLRLPDHLRVRFSKDKTGWRSDYLVP